MERQPCRDVIARCSANPLIGSADMPVPCSDIWNAGITRFGDEYLMLITVEMLQGSHAIYLARSTDGEAFTVSAEPFMTAVADGPDAPHETGGIRDPRITPVDGVYYITYVAEGDHGLRVALAMTRDFQSVQRVGYLSQVDEKNGALFPEKIDGRYALLTRPAPGGSIWLTYSNDLEFWGSHTPVMSPRGGHWDTTRIGVAAPPIEIGQGWLLLYYGEKSTSAGPLVRLGAAILDRENPARVLARSNIPILSPREKYERIGDVPNVVFSCGALLQDDVVMVYYGASDSCICLGAAPLDEIVATCFESDREF